MMGSYRIYSMLDTLNKKHGPHDFGRLCQILLCMNFKRMGFTVSLFQLSGRPDMIVVRGTDGFCIEVKAPTSTQVTLKSEDIDGVSNQGYTPLICVNTYPEVKPTWIAADARKIKPGLYRSISLDRYSMRTLQDEINEIFPTTLERYYEDSLKGVDCVRRELEEMK